MGQIGYGYGSEWHLMRLKANHQQWLNKGIKEGTGLHGNVKWLDFGFKDCLDQEILDVDTMDKSVSYEGLLTKIAQEQGLDKAKLVHDYEARWAGGGHLSFDSVVFIDGCVVPLEAKGHLSETCGGAYGVKRRLDKGQLNSKEEKTAPKRIEQMNRLLEKPFVERYGCLPNLDCYVNEEYYQLANRVMFISFLKEEGVQAKLVYLLFEGAFEHSFGLRKPPYPSANWDDYYRWYSVLLKHLGMKEKCQALNDDVIFLIVPVHGGSISRLYPLGASTNE